MTRKIDNDTCGIEKYEGTFDQDELGVTQIPTETILAINNITLLAVYTFLASRPSTWRLNAKHLANHFDCNKDKIYKALGLLIEMGFLTRTQIKEKGRFVRCHYRLHLRQKVQGSPSLEKPDVDISPCLKKPDVENQVTYKTESLENKEDITTTTCSSSFSSFENKCIEFKHPSDNRTPEEFIENVHHHIKLNSDPDSSEYQRQQMILKLLRNLYQSAAIFRSKGYVSQETKQETTKKQQDKKEQLLWSEYQHYIKSPIEIALRERGTATLQTFEEWKAKNV